jgi:hypothetical protein
MLDVDIVLAALPFGTLLSFVIPTGLALIALAFTVALLARANALVSSSLESVSGDDAPDTRRRKDDHAYLSR